MGFDDRQDTAGPKSPFLRIYTASDVAAFSQQVPYMDIYDEECKIVK